MYQWNKGHHFVIWSLLTNTQICGVKVWILYWQWWDFRDLYQLHLGQAVYSTDDSQDFLSLRQLNYLPQPHMSNHRAFSRRRWRLFRAKWQAVVFMTNPKIMQHMHGNIPYKFGCWADLVVHLLVLKSSRVKHTTCEWALPQDPVAETLHRLFKRLGNPSQCDLVIRRVSQN